jgi:hypothetical protein
MAASSTTAHGASHANDRNRGKTPAQWYCYLGGAALLLSGILGFLVDTGFDTGSDIQGDNLLGLFEVNGIHNLVHLFSGLLLLAAAPKRKSAKTVALAFGLVYLLVAIIGLIDGNTVLGLIPVNGADHALHIALALAGILAGIASDADDRGNAKGGSGSSGGDRVVAPADGQRTERFERGDVDTLSGRPRTESGEGRVTR